MGDNFGVENSQESLPVRPFHTVLFPRDGQLQTYEGFGDAGLGEGLKPSSSCMYAGRASAISIAPS